MNTAKTRARAQRAPGVRVAEQLPGAPPRFIEYAFYFSIFYSTMGDALGISVVPLMGAGLLAIEAAVCLLHRRARRRALVARLAFPLGCIVFYVAMQVAVHDESLKGVYVRPFVTWGLMLIIAQSLCLRRGFLHRFALAILIILLMTLPFLQLASELSELDRAGLERSVSIANSNDLAAWFGFCAVYFLIAGILSNRGVGRTVSWIVAVGCLGVVGLTVSRTALLAVGIATIVALRHVLKRGFVPLLLLVAVGGIAFQLGLFDRAVTSYTARGMEETGRLLVWPVVIERILDSPLIGVGASNVSTVVPEREKPTMPHNVFLFVALASGIVPLAFFVAYWWRAARSAFFLKPTADSPFLVPLFLYSFLIVQSGDLRFMYPWVIVTIATALSSGMYRWSPRGLRIRNRNRGFSNFLKARGERGSSVPAVPVRTDPRSRGQPRWT